MIAYIEPSRERFRRDRRGGRHAYGRARQRKSDEQGSFVSSFGRLFLFSFLRLGRPLVRVCLFAVHLIPAHRDDTGRVDVEQARIGWNPWHLLDESPSTCPTKPSGLVQGRCR